MTCKRQLFTVKNEIIMKKNKLHIPTIYNTSYAETQIENSETKNHNCFE